jgi:hypothetical protein
MTTALATLLLPMTADQVGARIRANLVASGFPVSDWAPTSQGGLENGLVDMVAGTLVDRAAQKVTDGIASGFLDFAAGDWLTFWAKQFYGLDRNPATSTVQSVTVTCSADAGPYNEAAGDLIVASSATGNRYVSIEAAAIPSGGSVQVQFQAEAPGSGYADPPLTIDTLVTALPGVTVSNARILTPDPAAIVIGGGSQGAIHPMETFEGIPPTSDRYRLQIIASGQSAAAPLARFQVSTDDGLTWVGPFSAGALVGLPGGCTAAFVDSLTANPSFIAGDVFFWANTAIIKQGSDAETDARLIERCRARWLTLSDVPGVGTVELWAKIAAPEVVRVRAVSDPNSANRLLVYVGSASGRAAPDTVVHVQQYVTPRLDVGEIANVLSVKTRAIVPTGTVTASRLTIGKIQAAANAAWLAYLDGLRSGATVRLAVLKQILKDAGAQDYSSLALTGGSPNIVLGIDEVPVMADGTSLTTALGWVPVDDASPVDVPSAPAAALTATTTDLTPSGVFGPPTNNDIKQTLIDKAKAIPGFPITDWASGGVMRTFVELETLGDADLMQQALPAMLGSAALDFAGDDFAILAAQQLYSLDRELAVTAVQNLTLTCDGSHGPYTITAGTLWFAGPTGNRWVNTTGGTLNTSGTLAIQIQAEQPGARYNDPAGTIKTLLTPLLGVTAVNLAGDFTAVTAGLQSTGTITPSRTSGGVTPTPARFLVRIDASGQVGAGAWSSSADGGNTWAANGAIGVFDLPLADGTASGTRVTFANGAGTPSFVAGDQFSFATPGTSFVTVGQDDELIPALIARCKARWPDLTTVPPESRFVKWAKAASAEVTRVRLEEDATYPGRLYLTLAGAAGAVSGGAVTAVQAYIDPRGPIGRILVARNSTSRQITAAGTVTVAAAKLAAAQAAAQLAWQAVLVASDIGQVVRLADLVRVVMDAGALDFTGEQLNGSAANVTLASTEVAVLNTTTPLLADQLTWQAV